MSKQADQLYHSFLVRCWLIRPETAVEPPIWRFELREVTADPQKHRFSNLEQLNTFLEIELTNRAVSKGEGNGKRKGGKPCLGNE